MPGPELLSPFRLSDPCGPTWSGVAKPIMPIWPTVWILRVALFGSGGGIEEEELRLRSSFFRHAGRKSEPESIPAVATDSTFSTGNRRCFMGILRSRCRYWRCGRSGYTWGGDESD
ncbi:hypothetical protein U1Q18_037884, partial [Sarracenia purpurea var. burkii]